MAISMVRTERCFVSPSHPILCEDRTRTSGWGWAVSYGQRPAGAANIWQGWGQVLHSFAPPPANTNTALSSEDPHFWRGHRRFCGGNISSSFIFCEWRPQILNLITHFLQMSLWCSKLCYVAMYIVHSGSAFRWCWILFLWWAPPTTFWVLTALLRRNKTPKLFIVIQLIEDPIYKISTSVGCRLQTGDIKWNSFKLCRKFNIFDVWHIWHIERVRCDKCDSHCQIFPADFFDIFRLNLVINFNMYMYNPICTFSQN